MPAKLGIRLVYTLGIVLLLASFTACKENEEVVLPPIKVNVVAAIQSDVPLYEDFVAQVYGQSDVDLRARVEGWVVSMNFKEGSKVKKGDLLYVIDDIEYKNRVDRQAGELARARSEVVRAENDLSRVRPLREQNALSQKDLDNSIASAEAARSQVKAAEASLENAKVELGYTRVYAPFDGVVGLSNVREGDYVSRMGGSSVLTTISDVEGMRVRFQISEREYLRIAKLSPEELETTKKSVQLILADGSVYPVTGEINLADRQIDPKTGTLTIEASFPNSTGLLRPGMYVKARVQLSTYRDAVLVPQRAVYQLQHLAQVYFLTDSATLKATAVETGPKSGDGWIIKSGIKAGDKVAIVGTTNLTPNAKIEPIIQQWPETVEETKSDSLNTL